MEIERKKKIKNKCDKKYRTAKLSKLVPGQTVYAKAPSDKGFKGLMVREDNSLNSYQVRVDQSEIRRDKKHLFGLHFNNSDNVEIGLPSLEKNDDAAESLVNDRSKDENIPQEKITPEREKYTERSPILNSDKNEGETPKIGDESETFLIVSEQESMPVEKILGFLKRVNH